MVVLYIFPIPLVLIIWLFDLKGLFMDYMYVFMLLLPLIPLATTGLGLMIKKR
jgi:hypothetical protein